MWEFGVALAKGWHVGIGGSSVGREVGAAVEERVGAGRGWCQRFARGQREDVGLAMSHQPKLDRTCRAVVYIDLYLAKLMAVVG